MRNILGIRFRLQARQGNALIATLIVVAFLTALMGAVSIGLLTESRYVTLQKEYLTAQYVARAGLETACRELLSDESRSDTLTESWSAATKPFENVGLGEGAFDVGYTDEITGAPRFGVVDEERKVNVNKAPPEVLKALSPAFTEEVVDTIVKAREKRPFLSLEDMAALPNIPPGFLTDRASNAPAGLASLLTVYGDGRVNVNTAPAFVLAALPEIGGEMAVRIVDLRSQAGGFNSVDKLLDALGEQGAKLAPVVKGLKASSEYFTIRSEGRIPNTNISCVLSRVVQRDGDTLVVIREERIQ